MSLSASARAAVRARLAHLLAVREHVVIDGDTHPSDPALYLPALRERLAADANYFHGRPIGDEELIAEMDAAGVDMALCWQNPAVLPPGGSAQENFAHLQAANAAIAELARRYPARILPAGWTDPAALGETGAAEMVRLCVEEWGMAVVKLNPAQNAYPIDSPAVLRLVDRIVGLGAVPAFHFGADTEFTPAEGLAAVAARHADRPVIGVHMGGGGPAYVAAEPLYQAARALGLARPNVFFVESAKRDTHIESDLIAYRLAGPPASRQIALGSDTPYGTVSFTFGGYRALLARLAQGATHADARLRARPGLFDAGAIADLLGRNLADLLIGASRAVLDGN